MDLRQGSIGEYRDTSYIDGGISGLPALYILDEMISRLQFDLNSYEELFLWQYFDIIIATGPGA